MFILFKFRIFDNMNSNYPLDVWESVLKEVGFIFIDEYTGPKDINCLFYRKEVDLIPTEVKIWFNIKTELITSISVEILHKNGTEFFPLNFFIHFYFDKFRDNLIRKILD